MIYIILALILYTAVVLTGTAASRHANTNVVAALANTVSAIIPVLIVLPMLTKKVYTDHKFGIAMAIVNGLFIAFFALAFTKSLSVNKVGIVTPILYGGTILLTTVLSYFIFKEKISLVETAGLSLILVGILVVIYARSIA